MKSFGMVITFLLYLAAMIISGLMFGMKAIALMLVACICTAITVYLIDNSSYEEVEPEHDSCDGCKNNLGGGHCKINLEDECCEGGGFEMWEE